jgi:AraC-like DNA-binding protein
MSGAPDIRWTFSHAADTEIMSAEVVDHRFGEHFHETWAIGCIECGACAFSASGRAHTARAGDVVIIPPYVVHTGGTDVGRLAYRMAYVGEDWFSSLSGLLFGALQVCFPGVVMHDPSAARRLSAALAPAQMRDAERKALLAQALVGLLARHAIPRLDGETPRVTLDRAGNGGNLLRIVGSEAVSQSALIRRFTRRFGLSPVRYLRNLRCVSAKRLLRVGLPISEVAHALSFSDQAHFTREFKKIHGITPGSYRTAVSAGRRA